MKRFIEHEFRVRLLDGCKLAINQKKDDDASVWRRDVIVNIFDIAVFFLSS